MDARPEEYDTKRAEFESPAWPAVALAETERELAEGTEQILDWEAGKKSLRSRTSSAKMRQRT